MYIYKLCMYVVGMLIIKYVSQILIRNSDVDS